MLLPMCAGIALQFFIVAQLAPGVIPNPAIVVLSTLMLVAYVTMTTLVTKTNIKNIRGTTKKGEYISSHLASPPVTGNIFLIL